MNTLLIRLAGPMQSWGVQSRFEHRDTLTEPTKSGVVGILASALGRRRDESVDDLSALRMGVRVDREGQMRKDYQTAQRWKKEKGSETLVAGTATLSPRYYLADARFLVGLESIDRSFLESLDKALKAPKWPLFLGRKSFFPGEPVSTVDGIQECDLETALSMYPWKAGNAQEVPQQLRMIVDAGSPITGNENTKLIRPDHPVSFSERKFTLREVFVSYIPTPVDVEEVTDVSG
ncbi:MAG: type I-E CRISPR-associated protein Cas5/CasD [Candidatus Kapaibacterium sp.]